MSVIAIHGLLFTASIFLENWMVHYFLMFLADYAHCFAYNIFKSPHKTIIIWTPFYLSRVLLGWLGYEYDSHPIISQVILGYFF